MQRIPLLKTYKGKSLIKMLNYTTLTAHLFVNNYFNKH